MNNKVSYKPISCAVHDEYESAIVLKQKLQIRWNDDAQSLHDEMVIASDLKTLNHEEFLIAESTNGVRHQIRLDRILSYNVITQNKK